MKKLLKHTAWPMAAPKPYSSFHICFTAAGITLAVFMAYWAFKKWKGPLFSRVIFLCGLFLTASEIWKQLFLYYIINQESYDWWYFPFQLCSLPMYFCLLYPMVKSEQFKTVLCTFMQNFNLLGGVMALAEPSGLLHPYWFLTLHGLGWHILLIFIGLYIFFSKKADSSVIGYFKTLPLFFICCLIADFINRTAEPAGQADMFYISPYYPSAQIVFHDIAMKLGITAGNLIYLFSICLGGFLLHLLFRKIHDLSA